MDFSKRTMEEIWQHHGGALAAQDIDEFVKDFADDCLFINNPQGGHASGIYRGPEGVRKWAEQFNLLFDEITDFKYAETFTNENTFVVLWDIHSKTHHATSGVDTFVVEDGKFKIVTVVYKVSERANLSE